MRETVRIIVASRALDLLMIVIVTISFVPGGRLLTMIRLLSSCHSHVLAERAKLENFDI